MDGFSRLVFVIITVLTLTGCAGGLVSMKTVVEFDHSPVDERGDEWKTHRSRDFGTS